MKRIGNLYDRICEREILRQAFMEASRGKKNKKYVRPYIEKQEHYIDLLQKWLREDTLKLSDNHTKIIYERTARKQREIVVPKFFPDQVIHWAYCIVLREMFMKGMYKWNCGSIKGRGVHYGTAKAQKIMQNPKAKYILKTDFRKYFQSVSIRKLYLLLARKIKDKKMLRLSWKILCNGKKGLPIGYYTSQWFANFYLERIDHFVKEQLHVPFYLRYVDDLVLADSNKRRLHAAKRRLDSLLSAENYNLTIKSSWQVWKAGTRPLDFLGFCITATRKRLRKAAFLALNRTVRKIKRVGYCTVHAAQSYLSRLGWLMKCSNGINYYLQHLKPIISKGEACTIVSLYDKKRNQLKGAFI